MPCGFVPFLIQVVRDIVPVTKRLDTLALQVDLNLVTDEKPFKIFTAVHIIIIIILMLTARR